MDVRVLGYMVMEDEKGQDEKVLAVLTKDPRYVTCWLAGWSGWLPGWLAIGPSNLLPSNRFGSLP